MCEIVTVTQLKHAQRRAGENRWRLSRIKLVMTTNSVTGSYRHTQTGTLILAATLGMAFVIAVLAILVSKIFWLTAVSYTHLTLPTIYSV